MTVERRVAVEGGDLAVTDYGGRGRTLVLVHSAGLCSDMWRRLAPLLTPHARVLAVDLRGHGQSTCELDSPDQLVADFERLVIDLDLRCPVILGHQYGGGIAAAVTAAYPLLWGALCVVDSPVISPQANYLGLMELFSSPEMIDELTRRFRFGAAGPDRASLEAFVLDTSHRLDEDWLAVPHPGGTPRSLDRSILRDASGGWVRRPTPRTIQRMTTFDPDFPLVPGRELLERSVPPVWVVQPLQGDYGDGFGEMSELAARRPGWAALSTSGGSFVGYTHPELLADTVAGLLATLPGHHEAEPTLRELVRRPSGS